MSSCTQSGLHFWNFFEVLFITSVSLRTPRSFQGGFIGVFLLRPKGPLQCFFFQRNLLTWAPPLPSVPPFSPPPPKKWTRTCHRWAFALCTQRFLPSTFCFLHPLPFLAFGTVCRVLFLQSRTIWIFFQLQFHGDLWLFARFSNFPVFFFFLLGTFFI